MGTLGWAGVSSGFCCGLWAESHILLPGAVPGLSSARCSAPHPPILVGSFLPPHPQHGRPSAQRHRNPAASAAPPGPLCVPQRWVAPKGTLPEAGLDAGAVCPLLTPSAPQVPQLRRGVRRRQLHQIAHPDVALRGVPQVPHLPHGLQVCAQRPRARLHAAPRLWQPAVQVSAPSQRLPPAGRRAAHAVGPRRSS